MLEAKLQCIVIDDEQPARQALSRQIERFCPGLQVVRTAPNAREGYRAIVESSPDVVFLDVRMPDESGLQMLDRFPQRDFYVVFCTTYHEYAVEALRKQAFDYLLKPVDAKDLKACAQRIAEHFYFEGPAGDGGSDEWANKKLELVTSGHRYFVKHKDILQVEASGSYATFYLSSGKRITLSKNLKRVEEMLNDPMFYRVHNSQLVRLTGVQSCNVRANTLTLRDGREVPMSVRKRDEVMQQLEALMLVGKARRRRSTGFTQDLPLAAEPQVPEDDAP
jgi:two-component system LytT family response regulator